MSCLKLLDEKLHVGLDDFAGSLRLGGCGKGGDVAGCGGVECSWVVPRFSVVWLWLRSDTPWPRPTPARGSKCNAVRKSALKGQSRRDRRKRIPGAARSFFHRLARAWEQGSLAGLASLLARVSADKNRFSGVAGCPRWDGESLSRSQLYRLRLGAGEGASLPRNSALPVETWKLWRLDGESCRLVPPCVGK